MIKVITYGTFDLFHDGHKKLLERAKQLGDYLIVAVTSDDFDISRGKINVQQSLIERIENVRATGLADEIIVEEFEGQKIEDIKRYNVDIFTVGSDWEGKFDYLKSYCKVVYLPRTQGISSSEIRSNDRFLKLGFVGDESYIHKYIDETKYVNGLDASCIYAKSFESIDNQEIEQKETYEELLDSVDAVYICSKPELHYEQIRKALEKGKHVLCESPIVNNRIQCKELFNLAQEKHLVLQESIKTAYSTAFNRMLLLANTGKIGKILSIDATCTSLALNNENLEDQWKSIEAWGPTALLPIFSLLGTEYKSKQIITHFIDKSIKFDSFTKINFIYDDATASIKVGKGIKSEGDLIISGTKGYIYVPAPWWKTDYFEIRFEDSTLNKRFYYQLDGEGIRNELVSFCRCIQMGNSSFSSIDEKISQSISSILQDYNENIDVYELNYLS